MWRRERLGMNGQRRLKSWTSIDSQWYRDNCCPACGRVNSTGRLCERTHVCKLCGTRQCENLSGRCKVCLHGRLSGYYERPVEKTCQYKGCGGESVAFGIRGKYAVCRTHFLHQFPGFEFPDEEVLQWVSG